MDMVEARLRIGGVDKSQTLEKSDTAASFRLDLKAGPTLLETWLTRPDGKQHGAYFATIRLEP